MEEKIIFKRKMYDRMLQWKTERNGSSALLIQGARRIGKSTLVEQFAKNEYESYLLIDFSKAPRNVHELFEDVNDLDYLFMQLQFTYHVQLIPRKSVIIFDEVQEEPLARQAIKHLVNNHRFDYIETGSHISVRKSSRQILIPSEETKIDMFPMDYEEFRWALGDTATIPLLRIALEKKMALGEAVHRRMMRDFRLYMLVGGMPQAVAKYLQTNNLSQVDDIKRDIISLYDEDLEKIDESGHAKAMFEAVPALLSKNVSRYKISSVIAGERQSRVADVLKKMKDSMLVNIACHSNDPNAGLALTKDVERYKMYVSDTGLFVTLAFKDKDFTENIIYEKILNDRLNANLGYVYENMVAQVFRANGYELFYHTFPTDDGKHYYELDFVLPDGFKISPVEVKSSNYRTHKSLDVFCEKYSSRIQNKFIISTKDLKWENGILNVPVYMAGLL